MMLLKNVLLLTLLIVCLENSQAQETSKKNESFLLADSLFSAGAKAYTELLGRQMRVPRETFLAENEGVLIVQIKMNKDGQMTAKFMTHLDEYMEVSFTEYLSRYAKMWQFFGQPYEVYQIFTVSTGTFSLKNLKGKVPEFPSKFGTPFAPIVTSRIIKSTSSPVRIKVNRKTGDTRPSEVIAKEQFEKMRQKGEINTPKPPVKPLISEEATLKRYDKLMIQYTKQANKDNLKKMHKSLTELIKFNPFNLEFLLKRYELETQLGINEFQKYDIPWIVALRKMKARKQLN